MENSQGKCSSGPSGDHACSGARVRRGIRRRKTYWNFTFKYGQSHIATFERLSREARGEKNKNKKRERSPGKIGKKEALSFCLLFHCYHKLPDEARGETAYSVMYSEGPGQAWHLELLQNAEPACMRSEYELPPASLFSKDEQPPPPSTKPHQPAGEQVLKYRNLWGTLQKTTFILFVEMSI